MEQKVYFQNSKGDRLCGLLLDSTGNKGKPVIIIVHGFSSNKNSKNYLTIKDILVKNKISTFRFDLWAHGESEGNFADITISEAVDDILQAIKFLKDKGYKKIGLLGSSFGGISSIIAASKTKDLYLLALKSPVSNHPEKDKLVKTKEELEEWKNRGYMIYEKDDGTKLRVNYTFMLDAQKPENDGYKAAKKITIPTLITHGDADESVPYQQSLKISKIIKNCQLATIKGADHTYTRPAHAKQMVKAFADFIVKNSA